MLGVDASLPECLPDLGWKDIEDTSSRRLFDCCMRAGAFYIVDDGRLSAQAPAVFREAQAFFSQPVATKTRLAARPDNQFLGYRGIGSEASMLDWRPP